MEMIIWIILFVFGYGLGYMKCDTKWRKTKLDDDGQPIIKPKKKENVFKKVFW